jgi:hypothetical protein
MVRFAVHDMQGLTKVGEFGGGRWESHYQQQRLEDTAIISMQ